jgi:hypothetical protein
VKILVEGHAYAPEIVENVLPSGRILLSNGKVAVENVGYYRSAACGDFVFFLPKVVLAPVRGEDGCTEDRAFCTRAEDGTFRGGFLPEALVDPETALDADGAPLSEVQKAFLCEFSVWIYRALARYRERNPGGVAWSEREPGAAGARRRYETGTLLDVILALLRFARENRDYVLFKVKERHSGAGRTDWRRTVAKSAALVREDGPVYPEPRVRKRMVDWDEELLVIFHSILAYVARTFGFPVRLDVRFDLVSGAAFGRWLAGYGVRRLRQIRYKYYSDRDRTLWRLCHAFFEKAHRTEAVTAAEEYLLAKDFERVFESMVDDLVGDESLGGFRELDDAKRIDHLYLDESLIRRQPPNKMFYIADSKYYKRGGRLGRESVAKQFTYARDFLQLDLDLFLADGDAAESVKKKRGPLENLGLVRDSVTEGYDVIPNFFVSATMPDDLSYEDDRLTLHDVEGATSGTGEFRNLHFENRLFDRDTLILSHYDVNFLYLVKLYAQANPSASDAWRRRVREKFRRQIRSVLENRFEFHAMMPRDGITDEAAKHFLRENFGAVLGKVHSPYPPLDGKTVYALALERPERIPDDGTLSEEGLKKRRNRVEADNRHTLDLLRETFVIVPCELGEDPEDKLRAEAAKHPGMGSVPGGMVENVLVVKGYRSGHLEAVRTCLWCPVDVKLCSNPNAVRALVLPHTNQADIFHVRKNEPVQGPMSPEAVKTEWTVFEKVALEGTDYWVFPISP